MWTILWEIFEMEIGWEEASCFSRRRSAGKQGGWTRGISEALLTARGHRDVMMGSGWAGVCRRITVCCWSWSGSPRPVFQSPQSRFASSANLKRDGQHVRLAVASGAFTAKAGGQQKKQTVDYLHLGLLYKLWPVFILSDTWLIFDKDSECDLLC